MVARGRWVVLGAVFALAACGGEKRSQEEAPVGGLRILGGEADEAGSVWVPFGEVPVGGHADRSVVLRNEGAEEASFTWVGPGLPFLIVEAPGKLAPRQEANLVFRLAPTEAGAFDEAVEIHSEQGAVALRLVGEAREEVSCELAVAPGELRFTVGAGEFESAREGRVRVSNVGTGSCRIDALRIVGDPLFSMPPFEAFELSPGGSREVRVHFLPGAGASAMLVIGAGSEEVRVPLGTKEENDCLRLVDAEEVLGVEGLGCGPGRLVVQNVCAAPLTIGDSASPGFSLVGVGGGLRLDAQASAAFEVDHTPSSLEEARGEIVIHAENGDRIRQEVWGRPAWAVESFLPTPEWTMDILIVLDVGVSLAAFQDYLDEAAVELSREMERSLDIDYRAHVTTTSMVAGDECGGEAGRLIPLDGSRPRTVTWDTPDREQVLLQHFQAPACAAEGGAGLAAIEAALGDGWPQWRQGDHLHVALLSAEDDTSPATVGHYADLFATALGENRFVDSLALRLAISPCSGLPLPARYLRMADLFPHLSVSSFCSTGGMSEVPFSAPYVFPLGHAPADLNGDGHFDEEDGIELFIEGERVVGRWVMYPERLHVYRDFIQPRLLRGSKVEIRYPRSCS